MGVSVLRDPPPKKNGVFPLSIKSHQNGVPTLLPIYGWPKVGIKHRDFLRLSQTSSALVSQLFIWRGSPSRKGCPLFFPWGNVRGVCCFVCFFARKAWASRREAGSLCPEGRLRRCWLGLGFWVTLKGRRNPAELSWDAAGLICPCRCPTY